MRKDSLPERKLVEAKANELEQEGYEVSIEPAREALPFDLHNYRPDLIARKGDGGIILDAKVGKRSLSVDRYQEIAERIASHAGWRFVLVTEEDTSEEVGAVDPGDLPSWQELQSRLDRVRSLIDEGLLEPGVMYLWGTIEGALRRRAMDQNLPVVQFPSKNLLRHMYSSGEVSIRLIDDLESVREKRNKAAHGLSVSLEKDELRGALKIANELIEQWRETSPVA